MTTTQLVTTPNGKGYPQGILDGLILVRHRLAEMTGQAAGRRITPLMTGKPKTPAISALWAYEASECKEER